MARISKYFLIWSFIFFIQGCSLLPHYDQLGVLKNLGESQSEIKADVRRQGNNFCKLKTDIDNNRLKRGMSKKHIFFRYGQAVFCKDVQNKVSKQVCIYRLPGSSFDTGLIYIYFDKKDKLDSWEIIR